MAKEDWEEWVYLNQEDFRIELSFRVLFPMKLNIIDRCKLSIPQAIIPLYRINLRIFGKIF
jgi:hypothetical protein